MSKSTEETMHSIKRAAKEEKRKEEKQLKNQIRLIKMDVRKKGGTKEEELTRMAGLQLESAKRLAEQSKKQIEREFSHFDSMVTGQAEELLKLARSVPGSLALPEKITSELTRLTVMISEFKSKRDALEVKFKKIDTDNPLTANAELLDIASELNGMQMDIATTLLPAAMDLYNLAPQELVKLKEKENGTVKPE